MSPGPAAGCVPCGVLVPWHLGAANPETALHAAGSPRAERAPSSAGSSQALPLSPGPSPLVFPSLPRARPLSASSVEMAQRTGRGGRQRPSCMHHAGRRMVSAGGHTFGCWGWDANVSFPGTHLGPSQGMKVAAKEFESGKGSIKLIKASPPHPPVPAACGGRGLWGNDQPDPARQSAELPARRGA